MSVPFTPQPQLGIHLTQCVLFGISLSSSGDWIGVTYSAGGGGNYAITAPSVTIGVNNPVTKANVLKHVNFADSPEHSEINAMNRRARNQVITSDGATLDLQIFNVNNGTDPSPLFEFWYAFDYFGVQWVEGTISGAIYLNTFLGVRGELDKPFEGRGEQMTTGHLLEVDPGTPQFTRCLVG